MSSRPRSAAVSKASKSLGELLSRDASASRLVDDPGPLPTPELYVTLAREAAVTGGLPALRIERRRRLAQIAAHDLCDRAPLETVTAALSDLAEACLQASLGALGVPAHLAVLGMGKLGGHELNYASDIDLVFVSSGDLAAATRGTATVVGELGGVGPEGRAYRIDLALRPEGRNGPLVRSPESFVDYYRRWAKPWEFQALLKARAVAGDGATGKAVLDATVPLVYAAEVPSERVAEIRRMKERVEAHASGLRRRDSDDFADVKLGPGGIRDIEFVVQLLQLVHGGADPSLRSPTTLDALARLTEGGYLAEDDGAALASAYRWLRTVEHRLQLWQERQVRHLPADPTARQRLARTMGFEDSPGGDAASLFGETHREVVADVRRRFTKLFYRPMIESLQAAGRGLGREALEERLRVFGFRDSPGAANTLHALVGGSSRRARILALLTPAMLRWLSHTPQPDRGLTSFLRLGEALKDRPALLAQLRDNPPSLVLLASVLGSGKLLGELLEGAPDEISLIVARMHRAPGAWFQAPVDGVEQSEFKSRERLVAEARASLEWRDPDTRLDGLRRFKRRETLRVAVADLQGAADVEEVGRALACLADACMEAALDDSRGFAVIGMGKLGGRELSYASDLDVMFVHDPDLVVAADVAERLIRAVGEVTPEGQAFKVDLGLRPEGKSGALVRSVESYLQYYGRWAEPWEHQALIKARFVAGDAAVGERLIGAARELAFPETVSEGALRRIRHLKARMERERAGRGADARRNLKLGPGGLSDIEFATQVLQLRHGHAIPELRARGTLEALRAAHAADLLSAQQAQTLGEAFCFLTRLRGRLFFIKARPVDALPVVPEELEALGVAMGFSDQPRQELEEAYLRTTRRARRVAEPLIYG